MREWKREDVGKGGGYSLNTAHGRRERENKSNKASYRDPKFYDRIPGLQVLLPSQVVNGSTLLWACLISLMLELSFCLVHCTFIVLDIRKPMSCTHLCWGTTQHIYSNDKIPEINMLHSKVMSLIKALIYRVFKNHCL